MKEGKVLARSWVKGVDVGGIDLEQLLFSEEIEEERIEITRKAAEKIKLAVDAVNKKMAENDDVNNTEEIKVKEEVKKIKEEAEKLNQEKILADQKRKQEDDRLRKKLEEEMENDGLRMGFNHMYS